MYFLVGIILINSEIFLKKKYFAPLRVLNLFIKSFVNPFVDITLTFFDSPYDSFLFDVTSFSLLSKSYLRN